jgi:tetratricopeptide (TPR) repeat protein
MLIDAFGGALNAAIKYNPHLWGADELRAIFVVRQTDLDNIMDAVRGASPDEVPQHMLICGHRGMGKSTLLRRIALAVNDEPALSAQWLPLNFPEEQYTVRTLTEFLLNLLDVLADTLEQAGAMPDDLLELDEKIAEISALPAEQAEAVALDYLAAWVKAHGKGLLLLVDSSDMLLNSLAQGEGKTAGGEGNASALWRLRRVLSHQAGLFWIGASYQALESQHEYQNAFHDFFALHELRPLDVAEMRLALLALARRFGVGRAFEGEAAANEMARILDSKPERLKTLRLLSGGNPRTMVTLFELFSAGGEESIHADLKRLLDVMTPLYKARMEALSEQARKILAHLMESWNPVGVRELEELSGISSTTISGQLNRLEVEGLIEKASLGGMAKRSGFQVAERFFNVWYLMRYGTRRLRQRLTWAVQFMRMWYSREELVSLAGRRARKHASGEINDSGNLEFSRAISGAMGGEDQSALLLDWAVLSAAHRETCQTRRAISEILPDTLFELEGADSRFKDVADYLKRFSALESVLMTCPHASPHERLDWARDVTGSLSLTLGEKEGIARQVNEGSLTAEQYGNLRQAFVKERESLVQHIGQSGMKFYQAVSEGNFVPYFTNSEVAYAQIEHCFADDPVAYKQAYGLFRKRMLDVWGERCLRKAIELNSADPELWFWLGWLLQTALAHPDEAVAAYRQSLALDEKQAGAWNNLGNLLKTHLRLYDEAQVAYRQAIALDGKDALIWNNFGNLLADNLKRYDEAEAAYRQAIALDGKYARPWNNLGELLADNLKDYEQAEAAYRQAIALDDQYALPWVNLGNLLANKLKRYEEAEAAYRQAIGLDGKYSRPWNNLGNLLKNHLKCYDKAEAAYRQAIAVDGQYAAPWNGLGNLLADNLKRYDEAEAAYRQAIALAEKNAYAVANLARLKARQGEILQAAELYRQCIELDDSDHLQLQAHLWLGNRDSATLALSALATDAVNGSEMAFFRLREQTWECFTIGKGDALAELMAECALAEFLLPFRLALEAAVADRAPVGGAPEILSLASEVLAEIKARS